MLKLCIHIFPNHPGKVTSYFFLTQPKVPFKKVKVQLILHVPSPVSQNIQPCSWGRRASLWLSARRKLPRPLCQSKKQYASSSSVSKQTFWRANMRDTPPPQFWSPAVGHQCSGKWPALDGSRCYKRVEVLWRSPLMAINGTCPGTRAERFWLRQTHTSFAIFLPFAKIDIKNKRNL